MPLAVVNSLDSERDWFKSRAFHKPSSENCLCTVEHSADSFIEYLLHRKAGE
jgi:hypothetical protein